MFAIPIVTMARTTSTATAPNSRTVFRLCANGNASAMKKKPGRNAKLTAHPHNDIAGMTDAQQHVGVYERTVWPPPWPRPCVRHKSFGNKGAHRGPPLQFAPQFVKIRFV